MSALLNTKELDIIIVDDELDACNNLKTVLTNYTGSNARVLGMAHSTRDAEKLIATLKPDAILLDINMPNEDAFQFLERISPFPFEVVFVTAYDEYAVKAFRLNAVDYILKPISIEEVKNAIRKVAERVAYKRLSANSSDNNNNPLRRLNDNTKQQNIIFRESNNLEVVDQRDIYFVEAHGSYSRIVFAKNGMEKVITMSNSIAEYEELLPADFFFRIHKSYLVNCLHVKNIVRRDSPYVVIKEEYTLPVSRRRFAATVNFLKKKHFATGDL